MNFLILSPKSWRWNPCSHFADEANKAPMSQQFPWTSTALHLSLDVRACLGSSRPLPAAKLGKEEGWRASILSTWLVSLHVAGATCESGTITGESYSAGHSLPLVTQTDQHTHHEPCCFPCKSSHPWSHRLQGNPDDESSPLAWSKLWKLPFAGRRASPKVSPPPTTVQSLRHLVQLIPRWGGLRLDLEHGKPMS